MEERTMKTLEEWKELGLKLSKAEKEKKKMEEKYKQVRNTMEYRLQKRLSQSLSFRVSCFIFLSTRQIKC